MVRFHYAFVCGSSPAQESVKENCVEQGRWCWCGGDVLHARSLTQPMLHLPQSRCARVLLHAAREQIFLTTTSLVLVEHRCGVVEIGSKTHL